MHLALHALLAWVSGALRAAAILWLLILVTAGLAWVGRSIASVRRPRRRPKAEPAP